MYVLQSMAVVYRPFPTSNHNCCSSLFGCVHVVYRPFPTSNHNVVVSRCHQARVVYRPFPTSNHNLSPARQNIRTLYIVRFLHQTTTYEHKHYTFRSCISSVSYIKPQQLLIQVGIYHVVYRPFPTSNHNVVCAVALHGIVVYRPFPTSNHNL